MHQCRCYANFAYTVRKVLKTKYALPNPVYVLTRLHVNEGILPDEPHIFLKHGKFLNTYTIYCNQQVDGKQSNFHETIDLQEIPLKVSMKRQDKS